MDPFVGPPEPESALAAHLSRQAALSRDGSDIGIGWKVGPAAASLFDAWATQDAINRGGVEANPIMAPIADNALALYSTKVGTGILAGIAAHKLARAGHPKWGRFVGGVNIAIPLAAGIHNSGVGR